MSATRFAAVCAWIVFVTGCSGDEPRPWNPAELGALTKEFVHIAEAYAVVDVCMPRLEEDSDARYRVVSEIEIKRYTQLVKMDTEAELARFFEHHAQRGGTPEQYEGIERAYREAHAEATRALRSVEACVETVSDYANTILHTTVRSLR